MDGQSTEPQTKVGAPQGKQISCLRTKWAMPILFEIRAGALRFSQIEKKIAPVSRKALADTLRLLEREGLIARTVRPTTPPRVEYSITPLGANAARAYEPIARFARQYEDELAEARRRFDERRDLGAAGS